MKKKVLFLINTLRDGGAEKILVDIVNNLNPERYDIEIRLIYKRGIYLDKLNSNVKLSFITNEPNTFFARQVSRLLPRLSSEMLHKIFIKDKYDVEIAFLEGYATKIVAGAPATTKKLAWVHCDITKTEWINGVFRSEQGFADCYKKFDEVISVSESVKNSFITRFGEIVKTSVKYNPVDDMRIRELSNEKIDLLPSQDKITLIALGRMTIPKNFIRLLKTVNNLIRIGYPIELWILGEGEDRGKLENFVIENNLQNNVIMPGFKSNPYAYIKEADLFVCSSIYEGFSTAATESIVLGVPVLTTDVAGMRELLGDSEYGLITENSDEDFECGLKKMLDNPQLLAHYGKMANVRSEFFEMNKRMKAIEELL